MAFPFRGRKQLSKNDLLRANRAEAEFRAHAITDPVRRAEYLALHPVARPKREVRRPVDGKPVGPSEHQEQSAVVSWWDLKCASYALPQIALFAIPNGGARDPITGSRLKAEGVRRGVLDLMLAVPRRGFHGLFIEMKVGTNKPSEEQKAYISYLTSAGYESSVHWSCASAIKAIEEYLA